MNTDITKDLILAYHLGRVRDPDLRKAIEDVLEWDPIIRRMYSRITDMSDGEPPTVSSRKDEPRRSTLVVEWALGAETTNPSPPELTPPPELPVRRVNQATKMLELLEAPEVVQYGVARVTIEVDGSNTFCVLVPFAADMEGGLAVRKAELWLSEVGIPVGKSSRAEFFVVPVADDNLSEFPLHEVQELAKKYAGNFAATDAIDLLITRLQHEGRK